MKLMLESQKLKDEVKEKVLTNYNDEWMQFKTVLLKQVQYFRSTDEEEAPELSINQ